MMPTHAFVRSFMKAGTAFSGQSGVLKTATMQTGMQVRNYHALSGFRFPGPLIDSPITKADLSLATPESQADKIRLNRGEITGMGLPVLQAGHRLNLRLDTQAVVSLIFRLLSRLPVDQPLNQSFDQFANELSDRLLSYTDLLSRSGDWYRKTANARKSIIEETFQQVYLQAHRSDLAPGQSTNIKVGWQDEPAYSEPVTWFSDDRRSVQLALPRELIEMNAEMFDQTYHGSFKDLTCALVIPRLSHGIFHVRQLDTHAVLHGEKSATYGQWGRIIANTLAMGVESYLTTDSACHSGAAQSLYQLPHRKETWALRFCVMKAMIKCPSVPEHYRTVLEGYMTEHFDIFEAVRGLPRAPKALKAEQPDRTKASKSSDAVRLPVSLGRPNLSGRVRDSDVTPWSIDSLYTLDQRVCNLVYRAAELNKFLKENPVEAHGGRSANSSLLHAHTSLA